MKNFLLHPYVSLALGLAFFPLAKLFYIPNYVFNFLTTLVHEIGHSLCGWITGMPSIPGVSLDGSGATVWGEQVKLLVFVIMFSIASLAFLQREHKGRFATLIVILILYIPLAFTKARFFLAAGGGMFLEIGGATVCFAICLRGDLERPFERPLYALWGWWMLLNRTVEAYLLLTSPMYRSGKAIHDRGLAAGLPSDLTQMTGLLGASPEFILVCVLILCGLALPAAIVYTLLRSDHPSEAESE